MNVRHIEALERSCRSVLKEPVALPSGGAGFGVIA
jgi:hypothetical protein